MTGPERKTGKISSFWRSKNGNVYFRIYGETKSFLIAKGVGEELIPYLAKNLATMSDAIDKGDYYLVTWLCITGRIHLMKDGQPVKWEDRELPFKWQNTCSVLKRRSKWLSEQEYNGYYEPLIKD